MTNLQKQLARAWGQGLSVQLSPLISGEATWHGEIAIYIYSPDPRNKEPWRGGPCHVAALPASLRDLLDLAEVPL